MTGGERRQRLGRLGEDAALAEYVRRGFHCIERNWRTRAGEIDLILSDRSRVVFCEVKTRSGSGWGTPGEAVTREKQARIRALAAEWLGGSGRDHRGEVRFDVASVMKRAGYAPEVEIIEGAF